MNLLRKFLDAFGDHPHLELRAARSELRRIAEDLETLRSMLNRNTDSFHYALGANTTAHVEQLEERRQLLESKVNKLLDRHPALAQVPRPDSQ